MDRTVERELDRLEHELTDSAYARPRDSARYAAALEAAVAAFRSWSEAADYFVESELLGDLSEEYEALGRYEEALTAMQAAIVAGYRGQPDPRCRLGAC